MSLFPRRDRRRSQPRTSSSPAPAARADDSAFYADTSPATYSSPDPSPSSSSSSSCDTSSSSSSSDCSSG